MLARLLLTVVLLAAFPAPAAALVEPLPGETWALPRDGAARAASSWPDATPFEMVEFTIYVDAYEEAAHPFDVEVSTSPALGPDGTLADADRIDSYLAAPRAASAQIFSARTNAASQWLSIPGAYYWQAHYEEHGELYGTPVHLLTITPRAAPDSPAAPEPARAPLIAPAPQVTVPAPLPASTVRIIVRRVIARATRSSPRGLLYRCVSAPGGAATCRPSWRDARFAYRGTLQIGTGLNGIHAFFTGTTAARSCVRRCARAIEWSTSL